MKRNSFSVRSIVSERLSSPWTGRRRARITVSVRPRCILYISSDGASDGGKGDS
jgi:hypothetical protein